MTFNVLLKQSIYESLLENKQNEKDSSEYSKELAEELFKQYEYISNEPNSLEKQQKIYNLLKKIDQFSQIFPLLEQTINYPSFFREFVKDINEVSKSSANYEYVMMKIDILNNIVQNCKWSKYSLLLSKIHLKMLSFLNESNVFEVGEFLINIALASNAIKEELIKHRPALFRDIFIHISKNPFDAACFVLISKLLYIDEDISNTEEYHTFIHNDSLFHFIKQNLNDPNICKFLAQISSFSNNNELSLLLNHQCLEMIELFYNILSSDFNCYSLFCVVSNLISVSHQTCEETFDLYQKMEPFIDLGLYFVNKSPLLCQKIDATLCLSNIINSFPILLLINNINEDFLRALCDMLVIDNDSLIIIILQSLVVLIMKSVSYDAEITANICGDLNDMISDILDDFCLEKNSTIQTTSIQLREFLDEYIS